MNDTKTAATIAAETAESVRVALADDLAKARALGKAHLVKRYGAGADNASITLARQAAAVLAGGDKPRGGVATRINAVIKAVEPLDVLDAAALARAARVVLDEHKAAEKARRDKHAAARKAAHDVLNDRGADKAARIGAFETMTELDAIPLAEAQGKAAERLASALANARDKGMTYESVMSLVLDAYPAADSRAELIAA